MEGTTLIITEKPQAAAKIAEAISGGKYRKLSSKDNVYYYEFCRDSHRYIVGCAVGHLFAVDQKVQKGSFPNFDVGWFPVYKRKDGSFSKKYFDVLKKLVRESDDFLVATDFDVEGEVIGWNVLRFIAKRDDAKRMKFSSLTKDELVNSFENSLPHLNWGAAYAGETRHYLDWFYGINLSRGLMKALSTSGKFRILSIGRVQGPALKILKEREEKIINFKPVPYWQIYLIVSDLNGNKIEVKYLKDVFKESDLSKFKYLKGKKGDAKTKVSENRIKPPVPFDMTTLQTESYRVYGFTPSQTLKIAQNLYLAGLISYPRTSSQKIPSSVNHKKILSLLKKYTMLVKYAVMDKPVEGKKDDPAHPAIYPTGELKKLDGSEKKVYDLIVKRFIASLSKDAVIENKEISVDVGGIKFAAKGLKIKEKNWMNVYPHSIKENVLPSVSGEVDINEIRIEEKETSPPKRYTAASLVRELEKRNLGTKATRASIVETLYSRGYIKGKSIEVTELGMRLVSSLERLSPIILDEKLTSEMNRELESIENSKSNFKEKEEAVLEKAKKVIKRIAKDFEENYKELGKGLADASEEVYKKEREENTMSSCPKCKKGKLRIMYGKKYLRYFVSCDNYPECKNVYSLPPKGLMRPSRDKEGKIDECVECGFPLVVSLKKGRAPWKFCFNPECPTNKDLKRKREEFKKNLSNRVSVV